MADAGAKVLRGLLDVFVLASLEQTPKHGYALLREMADAFGTEPNRNRLYPLLGRMVRDGLIREASEGATTRTLYTLTDAGRDTLANYRRLPVPFHARLHAIWPSTLSAAPAGASSLPAAPAGAAVTVPVAGRDPAPATSAPAATATPAPALPAGALPYPCADARVSVEKSPRTGTLEVRLTGCPMGAYDYCPLCPVSKAVDGLRKLTF